jgi:predicted transcriptional regulator
MISVHGSSTLREFADSVCLRHRHIAFPVLTEGKLVGVIAVSTLGCIDPKEWPIRRVEDLADRRVMKVVSSCDVMEALRLLLSESGQHMLFVTSPEGKLEGILTKTDILSALKLRSDTLRPANEEAL